MKRVFTIVSILFFCFTSLNAIAGFSYQKLDNGLDVFIMENHSAPLVYIEIALKAGAIVQQKETAGLFHLYEHIIFKGNSKYKNASEVQRALNDMGVTKWNGSTGDEFVNYYFTVPKSELEKGLEFWSYAIREPAIDEVELENEKKVVISEITGGFSEPARQFASAINYALFPDYPWQLDPSGSVKNISECSVEKLRQIQKEYYTADNAALFIGGDVEKEEVTELVKKYYGDWEKSTQEAKQGFFKQTDNPCKKRKLLIMADPQVSPVLYQLLMVYRGPDTALDVEASYGADVFGSLTSNPSGRFIKSITEDPLLKIPGADYFSAWYQTKLSAGRITFIGVGLEPENDLVNKVNHFYEKIAHEEIPKMINDKNYFSKQEFKTIKQQLKDQRLIDTERPEGFLSSLRFWWASAPAGYYFTYEDKINAATKKDVNNFLTKYVLDKEPVIAVKVNPLVYEKQKEDFLAAGYEVITEEKAFYWKNEKPEIQGNSDFIAFSKENAERPSVTEKSIIHNKSENIEIHTLKNQIPLYIQKTEGNRILNLRIIVEGGVHYVAKEKQGLEDALFKMMCTGTKKFPHEKLEKILHEKNASISGYGRKDFSQLQMNCLDYYFDDIFSIFIDGFLNPSLEESEFEKLITTYNQEIQQREENPESLLSNLMADQIFLNHPYELKASPVKETIEKITIENMKEHLASIHNGKRIFIVASGNFNSSKLIKKLNKTIGKISSQEFESTTIPPLKYEYKKESAKCAASKNTSYNALVFPYPAFNNPDYYAACITSAILDEYLFNNVREQNGTCYSVWNGVYGAKVNFGYIFGLKINDLEKYKASVKKTLETFADISEEEIDNRLRGFKNSFINSTYAQQETNSGIGSTISSSILFYGSADEYKNDIQRINAVSASDVKRVFKSYWLKEEMSDFTVTE